MIPSARRLCPSARMFLAALRSRSCKVPHCGQSHSLIPRPSWPLGPVRLLHTLQVWVENASLTSSNHTPALSPLYLSMVRNAPQPASSTDLALLVLASACAFTLPTKIAPYRLTSWVLN